LYALAVLAAKSPGAIRGHAAFDAFAQDSIAQQISCAVLRGHARTDRVVVVSIRIVVGRRGVVVSVRRAPEVEGQCEAEKQAEMVKSHRVPLSVRCRIPGTASADVSPVIVYCFEHLLSTSTWDASRFVLHPGKSISSRRVI